MSTKCGNITLGTFLYPVCLVILVALLVVSIKQLLTTNMLKSIRFIYFIAIVFAIAATISNNEDTKGDVKSGNQEKETDYI